MGKGEQYVSNSRPFSHQTIYVDDMITTVLYVPEAIIYFLVCISGLNKLFQAIFLVCRRCPFSFAVMLFYVWVNKPRSTVKTANPKNGEYNINTRSGARFDSISSPSIAAWNQLWISSETNLNHGFAACMDVKNEVFSTTLIKTFRKHAY